MDAYTIRLRIPSLRGMENIATAMSHTVATHVGLEEEKTLALDMVLTEACLNAMEHGNHFHPELGVTVEMEVCSQHLDVTVLDQAASQLQLANQPPDIARKVAGQETARGWGMFLMREMVDEFRVEHLPGQGNRVHLVMHRSA